MTIQRFREEPPYESEAYRRETNDAGPLIRCACCDYLGPARVLHSWNDRARIDSIEHECPRCHADETSGLITPLPDDVSVCDHCHNAIALPKLDLCLVCNREFGDD